MLTSCCLLKIKADRQTPDGGVRFWLLFDHSVSTKSGECLVVEYCRIPVGEQVKFECNVDVKLSCTFMDHWECWRGRWRMY